MAKGDGGETLVEELNEAKERADMEFILEETPAALRQAGEGLKQIASIVGAMKEFAHPGGDELESVDINHLIENTVVVTKNEWKYVATLEKELDEGVPAVLGMHDKLGQVFLNLIVNAAHAIGEVKESGVMGKISIATRRVDGGVEVRFCDDGPGIPAEIQDRIFDPFFTTKGVGKGSGQGLAIAHSIIVELHKGRIQVEENDGGGACFVISLPAGPV